MQRQVTTLLDKAIAAWRLIFNKYKFASLNQKQVNFDSVDPFDIDAAEQDLLRANRLVEAAKVRQAKRDGWVYPAKKT